MGGLLILFLGSLYIWGAFKVVGLVSPNWAKSLLILIFVLIPTADAVYGRIKLQQMCAAEGGLKIYRVVEGVEGFDDPNNIPREESIKNDGYRFVEGIDRSGKRSRMRLGVDGVIGLEVDITPISEYIYDFYDGNSIRDVYFRTESRIRVRASGEILSRAVNISYAGGWVERLISGIYAARSNAGNCGQIIYRAELLAKTLKPIK